MTSPDSYSPGKLMRGQVLEVRTSLKISLAQQRSILIFHNSKVLSKKERKGRWFRWVDTIKATIILFNAFTNAFQEVSSREILFCG